MIEKFKSVTVYLSENREINLCPKFVVKDIEINVLYPSEIQEKLNVDSDTAFDIFLFLEHKVIKEKICETINKNPEYKWIKPANLNISILEHYE